MLHKNRVFGVKTYDSLDALADALFQYTWVKCAGLRWGDWLLLNDSFSEDGAQEYAVVRESDMVQVESLTVSWMSKDELLKIMQDVTSGQGAHTYLRQQGGVGVLLGVSMSQRVTNVIEDGKAHHCGNCA